MGTVIVLNRTKKKNTTTNRIDRTIEPSRLPESTTPHNVVGDDGVNNRQQTSFENANYTVVKPDFPNYAPPVVKAEATPLLETPATPLPELPKWYKPLARKQLHKELVKKYTDEYAEGITLVDGTTHKPTSSEVKAYCLMLRRAKLKDLANMGAFKSIPLKLDLLDQLKSIDKKKHAVVTIFNDNKVTDTGVIHCYDRTFTRADMRYLVMSSRGYYDPEFSMTHFYYFANDPFPMEFIKGQKPEAIADAKLLDDTIEFEVITALANIDMGNKVNMIMLLSIIGRILEVVTLLVCLRGFKII